MKQTLQILTLLSLNLTVFGQNQQGYIEYQKAVQSTSYYINGIKKIEQKEARMNDTLDALMAEYQFFLENKVPDDSDLDPNKKAKLQKELESLQTKMQDYFKYAHEEIQNDQKLFEKKLQNLITEELKQFCIINNITCISKKEAILYCSDCYDYTMMFTEFLKRKK